MKRQQVFITGATGFVGRSVAHALTERGYVVRGFGLGEQFFLQQHAIKEILDSGKFTFEMGSILDKLALLRAMEGCGTVIHLAAMKGGRTNLDPLRCFDINVTGTQNVLSACVEANVDHFVFASSSAVYGEPWRNPVAESDDLKPINTYGVTKLAAEELVKGFAATYPQLSYTSARMFNVYGELNNSRFVIDMFVSQVLRDENPVVFGEGRQKRCFTHVDDIAKGIADILETPKTRNKTYNLGFPSETITIRDLAQRVIDTLKPGSGLEVEYADPPDANPAREIVESFADISLARQDFGFEPSVRLEAGLRRLAEAPKFDQETNRYVSAERISS